MDSCHTFPNFVAAFNSASGPRFDSQGLISDWSHGFSNQALFEEYGSVPSAQGLNSRTSVI
jgi:hypothetical protein